MINISTLIKPYAKKYTILINRNIQCVLLKIIKISVNIFYSNCKFNLHTFTFVVQITLNQIITVCFFELKSRKDEM